MLPCLLCHNAETQFYYKHLDRTFCKCSTCGSVFVHPDSLPKKEDEKKRYQLHENNIEDKGYQLFVSPLIEAVSTQIPKKATGLDFGSGPTPIIAILLRKLEYNVALFDPFFCNTPEVFNTQYDFISSCEVIEHLHHPLAEFKRLYRSLKPKGKLFCMTDFLPPESDFKNWYYKNDTTHVLFYSPENLEWIKETCGFKTLDITGRVIVFSK